MRLQLYLLRPFFKGMLPAHPQPGVMWPVSEHHHFKSASFLYSGYSSGFVYSGYSSAQPKTSSGCSHACQLFCLLLLLLLLLNNTNNNAYCRTIPHCNGVELVGQLMRPASHGRGVSRLACNLTSAAGVGPRVLAGALFWVVH